MYAPLLLFMLNSIDYIVPVFVVVVYCCTAVPLLPHPLVAVVLLSHSISSSSFHPRLHRFPHTASLYDEVAHFNFSKSPRYIMQFFNFHSNYVIYIADLSDESIEYNTLHRPTTQCKQCNRI